MRRTAGLMLTIALTITACTELGVDPAPIITTPDYPLDAVKLITPEIGDGDDATTYLQKTYVVGPDARLLLRREDLASRGDAMVIDDDDRVRVDVHVVEPAERAAAIAAMSLCPLNKNWMMLATWERAHPFGKSGRWATAGADYREESCVPAAAGSLDTEIVFDVSAEVSDRVRGLGQNLGFVLRVETGEYELYGDGGSKNVPGITWTMISE